MKFSKRIAALILALTICFGHLISIGAFASTADLRYFERGVLTDGEHTAYYIIDKDNRTIYLTGDGVTNAQTPDYPDAASGPFAGRTDITKVVIEEDVARVGDYVFANLKSVDTLEIQSNLLSSSSSMSSKAMSGCTGLRNVQADSSLISTNVLLEVIKGALNIVSGNWLSLISNGISIGKTGVNGDGSLSNEVIHAMVNDYIMTGEEVFLGDLDEAVALCQAREEEPCYWENAYHHNYQSHIAQEPGCENDGERIYTCAVCGAFYSERFGSALGHSYDYTTLYEASCLKEGISKGVCIRCGEIKFVSIPAKGHTDGRWVTQTLPDKNGSGVIKCLCADCGEITKTVNVTVEKTTYIKYKVGLNPENNSARTVAGEFETSGFASAASRNGVILGDDEAVGTGCKIYVSHAASKKVYEIDTVVLYGDLDGDGVIDEADYALMSDWIFSFSQQPDASSPFRRAADLNSDGVVDAFDLSILDLQLSGEKQIDQSVPQY